MDLNPLNVAIILNGPPRCGKDTIAAYLNEYYAFDIRSFKQALFAETAKYYGVSLEWILDGYEDNKDSSHPELNNITKRQALIHVSENVIKPHYSKDFFGRRAAESCRGAKLVAFPDGGFEEEIGPVAAISSAIYLVRIHRPGKTFDGDSRSYLSGDKFDGVFDVDNDQGLDELYRNVDAVIYDINNVW